MSWERAFWDLAPIFLSAGGFGCMAGGHGDQATIAFVTATILFRINWSDRMRQKSNARGGYQPIDDGSTPSHSPPGPE